MSRNQVTITVSGGSPDENRQLSSVVHAALGIHGFSNVSISPSDMVRNTSCLSVLDLVRSMNPEVFDTPIEVVGENNEDIAMMENAALYGLMPNNYSFDAAGTF